MLADQGNVLAIYLLWRIELGLHVCADRNYSKRLSFLGNTELAEAAGSMRRILIACGGTGGHLAPGIAVAETLQARGHHCVLLISEKQVDSALIKKYDHLNFHRSPGRAFSGGLAKLVGSVTSLFSAMRFSRRLIRDEAPDLVLVFGGFVSVGLGLAARLSGIPVAAHEANACPGRAVRLISRFATRIYLPDGVELEGIAMGKVRYFGYPVRHEIIRSPKETACERLGIASEGKLLVVIGGSQGATALNDWASEQFVALAELGVSLYCVTGLGKQSVEVIEHVNANGTKRTATYVPFSDAMADVLSAADLVLSRAGAGSIAEIIRCRAPSILVPYPYAADDHQMANAAMYVHEGAGLSLDQKQLDQLFDTVTELMFDPERLDAMQLSLERLDAKDACDLIASDIEALSQGTLTEDMDSRKQA